MQANKQQQRAIAHNTGPALILAGPGSGKTFTTVERVRYLIEVHHADPSHILVITFTKAAARQMRDRFFARMDNQFFPVTFGTFHAVFFHILKTSCHYNGSSILKEKEKREYLRAALLTLPKKFYAQNDGKMDQEWEQGLLSEISGSFQLILQVNTSADRNLCGFSYRFKSSLHRKRSLIWTILRRRSVIYSGQIRQNLRAGSGNIPIFWWMSFRISTQHSMKQ